VLGLPGLAVADNIAQISEVATQGNQYILTNPGSSTGQETFTASVQVEFSFNTAVYTGLPVNDLATLTMSASTSGHASSTYGIDVEGGFSGYFEIIDNVTGNDLLSATFGPGAGISGIDLGSGMTFYDSDTEAAPNDVTFQSDYLNFQNYSGTEVMTFSLSNLSSVLRIAADQFLASTTGSATATFSATPPPTVLPEPGTLVMAGAALLGLGFAFRKRRLRRAL